MTLLTKNWKNNIVAGKYLLLQWRALLYAHHCSLLIYHFVHPSLIQFSNSSSLSMPLPLGHPFHARSNPRPKPATEATIPPVCCNVVRRSHLPRRPLSRPLEPQPLLSLSSTVASAGAAAQGNQTSSFCPVRRCRQLLCRFNQFVKFKQARQGQGVEFAP